MLRYFGLRMVLRADEVSVVEGDNLDTNEMRSKLYPSLAATSFPRTIPRPINS